MTQWSRRQVLGAGLAAGGTALAGCSSEQGGRVGGRTDGSEPATSTTALSRPGSLNDVDHVVILIQENRSFDHYFGMRDGVRGFRDTEVLKRPDGRPIWFQDTDKHPGGIIHPFHLDPKNTNAACGADPPHGWFDQHNYWDAGRLGGFARLGTQNMGYFLPEDIAYHTALADNFTLCDHSFCSVIGPTTPNRLYAWTASIDAEGVAGGPAIENFTGPFRWETYPERLQKAGVSWRVYHEEDDFDDNSLKYFANFQNLAATDPLYDAAIRNRPSDAFATDVAAGNLPQVSWIVAPTAESEHPGPGAPWPGIAFVARQLGALMNNPKVWAKTVFILTYDENGGWFDHVPPPVAPPGTPGEFAGDTPIGLGFRVPTIVASPWSRGGQLSSTVFDLTSTLRLLETRFGVEIPNLSTWRRETCGDLSELLDFSSTDLTIPQLPEVDDAQEQAEACRSLPELDIEVSDVFPLE